MGEDGIRCRSASGTPASALADLAKGGEGAGAALTALKRSVQARYERATWLQVARRLNDRLRQARRDALVAYFKHQKGLASDEALFSELLMDAGPDPVVPTSRISNAMRTARLFVHSVQLGTQEQPGPPPRRASRPPAWLGKGQDLLPAILGGGNHSRDSSARLRPVTMPSFADSAWNSIATRLASSTIHNSPRFE